MNSSKGLDALKSLLWLSHAERPEFYKSDGLLVRYLNSGAFGEAVVLHHSCPVLVNSAVYNVAYIKSKACGVKRDVFLRTVGTAFEFKDYVIEYRSNEWYIEIDCGAWSQMERRLVPECVRVLVSCAGVNGRRLVLLRNVDALNDATMNALKAVMLGAIERCDFVCSMRRRRLVNSGSWLVIHCDYDVEVIVKRLLETTRKDLAYYAGVLASRYRGDLSMLCAILQYPRPLAYIPHYHSYVREFLDELMKEPDDAKAFELVNRRIGEMMSAFIGLEDIWPIIVDHFKDSKCEVIEALADAQVKMVRSNKTVFALTYLIFSLRSKIRCG